MNKVLYGFNGQIALVYSVKGLLLTVTLLLTVIVLYSLSLVCGSFSISVGEVFNTLLFDSSDKTHDMVVWSFRMPRATVAILVGAMLALSGATLQVLTRNVLADPSLIGISQGAGFAVVGMIVIFSDWPDYLRPVVGFIGAMTAALIIQLISSQSNRVNTLKFILIGIGFSAFISSLTAAMLTYGDLRKASAALAWLAGSLNSVNGQDVIYLSLSLAILSPILLLMSRALQVMSLGDDMTIGFGVTIKRVKIILIALTVGLAGVAVSIAGPIGFIGLLAPHIAKKLNSWFSCGGMALQLIHSALAGAIILMLADLLGRAAFGSIQIQAGLLTPVIGVPFFILLLASSRKKS